MLMDKKEDEKCMSIRNTSNLDEELFTIKTGTGGVNSISHHFNSDGCDVIMFKRWWDYNIP